VSLHSKQERIGYHFKTCSVTMDRWSVAHRTAAVRVDCETKSIIQTWRRLRQQLNVPRHGPIPSCNVILGWVHKFEDTGSLTDIARGAPRTARTEENVQRVRESSEHSPHRSARQQ
jgi:transposase